MYSPDPAGYVCPAHSTQHLPYTTAREELPSHGKTLGAETFYPRTAALDSVSLSLVLKLYMVAISMLL